MDPQPTDAGPAPGHAAVPPAAIGDLAPIGQLFGRTPLYGVAPTTPPTPRESIETQVADHTHSDEAPQATSNETASKTGSDPDATSRQRQERLAQIARQAQIERSFGSLVLTLQMVSILALFAGLFIPSDALRSDLLAVSLLLTSGPAILLFIHNAQQARSVLRVRIGWIVLTVAVALATMQMLFFVRGAPSFTMDNLGYVGWSILALLGLPLVAQTPTRSNPWRSANLLVLSLSVVAMGIAVVEVVGRHEIESLTVTLMALPILAAGLGMLLCVAQPSTGYLWMSLSSTLIAGGHFLTILDYDGTPAHDITPILFVAALFSASLTSSTHVLRRRELHIRWRAFWQRRRCCGIMTELSGVTLALILGFLGSAGLVLGRMLNDDVPRIPALIAAVSLTVGGVHLGSHLSRRIAPLHPWDLEVPLITAEEDPARTNARAAMAEGLTTRQRLADLHLDDQRQDQIALLLLDIDNFHQYNSALGWQQGDQLLNAVADRVHTILRGDQTLARLGGDDFAILLPDASRDEAKAISQALRSSLLQPFIVGDETYHLNVTLGIAHAVSAQDDPSQLLQQADIALEQAKQGRDRISIYDAQMHAQMQPSLKRVDELRSALQRGELEVHLQPQVHLQRAEIVGAEALARWRHTEHGMLMPDTFLPLAAATGLMSSVAEQVVNRALEACAVWWLRGYHIPVSINLAAEDLTNQQLPLHINAGLARHGLPPRALSIEITEGTLIQDRENAAKILRAWRSAGHHISIDDYGTGYSALSYLQELPIDELKLDRSFIRRLHEPETATIVRHTISMAKQLGLRVVAEGVETGEQAYQLRHMGAHLGQGMHFGSAVTTDRFFERLRTRIG